MDQGRTHPILIAAGIAVLLFSLLGAAALTGVLPSADTAVLLAFMVIGLCAWITRSWVSARSRNRYSEIFVYFFAAAGALYSLELLISR